MKTLFAAMRESGFGTFRTCQPILRMSAIRGRLEVSDAESKVTRLTLSDRPTRGVPRLTTSVVASVDSIGRRADVYCQVGSSNWAEKRSRSRCCPSSWRPQRALRP